LKNLINRKLIAEYNRTRISESTDKICHAPFKSMYFAHYGRAVACCNNRTYGFGTYPEMTIKEIWFGEKATQLRDYISNNDLNLGCRDCKSHFQSRNFDAIKARMYDQLPLNENSYPSCMELELGNTCNLECVMCSGEFSSAIRLNHDKKPLIKEPYDKKFIEQLEEFLPYLNELKFYGGEPFLIDIYYDIWDKIAEINPDIHIIVQTNGTVLNSRVKKVIEKGEFHITISLDSLQKENYEKIRKNSKFEDVIENIKYFHDYCKTKNTFFGISVCAMKQNYHELPELISFCNKLDVPVYIHTIWFPLNCSLWNLASNDLAQIFDYLSEFDFPAQNAIQEKNKIHYSDLLKQVKQWHVNAITRDKEKKNNLQYKSTIDSFYTRIEHEVGKNHELSCNGRKDRLKRIFKKIDKVFKLLPGDYPLESVLEILNDKSMEYIVEDMENNSVNELVEKLRQLG